MPIISNHQTLIIAEADQIRAAWGTGDHAGATAMLRVAHRDVLRWLSICSSVDRDVKDAAYHEHMRRMTGG